jgi:hypothetical protein
VASNEPDLGWRRRLEERPRRQHPCMTRPGLDVAAPAQVLADDEVELSRQRRSEKRPRWGSPAQGGGDGVALVQRRDATWAGQWHYSSKGREGGKKWVDTMLEGQNCPLNYY